jgi:peroxiredoxin
LLGITFSPAVDLKTWRDEVGLATELLRDADRAVAMAYGAAASADQEKATRVSVLVGPDGRVVKTYATPDAEGHPAEALADLA